MTAGKVAAGLAEGNGGLPPEKDLKSHLRADCLYIGISSGPTLGSEYGRTLPFKCQLNYAEFDKFAV